MPQFSNRLFAITSFLRLRLFFLIIFLIQQITECSWFMIGVPLKTVPNIRALENKNSHLKPPPHTHTNTCSLLNLYFYFRILHLLQLCSPGTKFPQVTPNTDISDIDLSLSRYINFISKTFASFHGYPLFCAIDSRKESFLLSSPTSNAQLIGIVSLLFQSVAQRSFIGRTVP